ncbi:YjbH domain-containing protein [Ancylomarina sp. YFZ004]
MKQSIQLLLLICFPLWLSAQATSGSTGLLNIPSAEMQRDGTFMFGSNYLPENITPSAFSYNTGNYFLNLTFLPFLELTYRCTLFKMENSGRYTNQDRSFTFRAQLLKEKKYLPALLIGGNDIFSSSPGENDILDASPGSKSRFYRTVYSVASKNFNWKGYNIGLSLGSGLGAYNGGQLDGVFGGVSVSPSFMKQFSLIAEYDSQSLNVGASVLLFKHLYLHAFANDLKHFVGGFAYKIYLKGNKLRVNKGMGYRIRETRIKGKG